MKNRYVSVGLFMAGGFLLLAAGLFLIGDRRQAFGRHVEYYTEFGNLAGLAEGAKVRVGGLDAGKVLAIEVPDAPKSRFRVKWRVNANLGALVRTDSVASIETEGIVGGTYVNIRPGGLTAPPVAASTLVPSREPIELSELVTRGNSLLADAQTMLKQTEGKLNGTLDTVHTAVSNVNEIAIGLRQGRGTAGLLLQDEAVAKQVRTTAASVDEVVAGLKAGHGPAGMLLRDDQVAAQIRKSLDNVQTATSDLGQASHQVNAMVAAITARQLPEKIGTVVDNVADTTQKVRQMVSEVEQPDRQGFTAAGNIRESLTNANAAASRLADASEALKHNFLLRGFFRGRGYYNLDRISPDQYRQDRTFTSRANHRLWFSARELFRAGANGQEEFSSAGVELLEQRLAEDGDSVFAGPVVIEGYHHGSSPLDQLRLSRGRAILVRQHLETRFQLGAGNLGIVALKSSPPNGVGRTAWDGICVVLLKRGAK